MAMETEHMEQHLMALSSATIYPATPDLAARFWRRLEAERASAEAASPLGFVGFAVAAAVVVVSVMLGTVTPVRDAAADLFDSINVFETDRDLSGLPADVTGEETTLEAAFTALGRPIEEPSYPDGLTLDRVLLQDFGNVRATVLYYTTTDGNQFALFVTNAHVGKGISVDSGAASERVTWAGTSEAYWITGPHLVEYYSEGEVIPGSSRQTGENTLVWEREGLVHRLEGDLDQDEAIRIAQSLGAPE